MLPKFLLAFLFGVVVAAIIWFRDPIWGYITYFYHLISDRELVRDFIMSFGVAAPAVFMTIQALQVVFVPVPGEATGFIGGYLFGAFNGFVYSSVALAIGSLINFGIGRFLGVRFVRKMIPADKFENFNAKLQRQGVIVLFLLFVFPGFPKDYLCMFLGLSTLSLKLFILIAAIGRMPGTLLLSLQGEFLYEQNYMILGIVAAGCAVLAVCAYRYRETLYLWIERLNHSNKKSAK
jgi:uncharacterized membrane protein YdjX (TVP38/TMEM64 family)